MREAAIARWRIRAIDAKGGCDWRIARRAGRGEDELRRIGDIIIGIKWIGNKLLRRRRERATQHRFVDEVNPKLESVVAHDVAHVVAELIFILIAQVGENCDRGCELIVAECFKAGDGERSHAERELYGKAEIGIASRGKACNWLASSMNCPTRSG